MGDIEVGTCMVCSKENVQLRRTYFNYPIKCECHSPNHFEIVRHCKDCEAEVPEVSTVLLSEQNHEIPTTIKMILPDGLSYVTLKQEVNKIILMKD